MTLFIRDKNNKTIVDLEIYIDGEGGLGGYECIELHSTIVIPTYSKLLLSYPFNTDEIIADFTAIAELRGWLNETYFQGRQNDGNSTDYEIVLHTVRTMLKYAAKKYELYYVED